MNPIHAQDTASTTGAASPTTQNGQESYQIEIETRFPKANATTLFVHACGEVDDLRRELTEARAEVERLTDLHVINGTHKANLNEVITDLRAQLATLQADKARLDFLDENMTRFTCYSEPEANGDWYRLEYWKRSDSRATHMENAFGPDLRAAIDAAITEQPG